jgi:hypothetical protein
LVFTADNYSVCRYIFFVKRNRQKFGCLLIYYGLVKNYRQN